MQSILEDKQLWFIVNGEETLDSAADNKGKLEYKMRVAQAKATIRLRLSESVLVSVQDEEDPTKLWEKLKSLYQDQIKMTSNYLRAALHNVSLESEGTVQKYATRIQDIVNDLSLIEGMKVSESEHSYALLRGLPDSWKMVKIAIQSDTSAKPAAIIQRLKAYEVGERIRKGISSEVALFTRGKGSRGQGSATGKRDGTNRNRNPNANIICYV